MRTKMTALPHGLCLPVAVLVAGLVFVGCGDESSSATAPPDSPEQRLGRQVFMNHCATCHQPSAQGLPGAFPPLVETEWVLGDRGRLIRLLLHGMKGPIEVKGDPYDNVMIPHGFLNDEQIAAVLTYVRSNFGNDASPVTPEEVAAVRAASDRDDFWAPDELEGRTGIPGVD